MPDVCISLTLHDLHTVFILKVNRSCEMPSTFSFSSILEYGETCAHLQRGIIAQVLVPGQSERRSGIYFWANRYEWTSHSFKKDDMIRGMQRDGIDVCGDWYHSH